MGNNTSSDGATVQRPVRPFSRNGALGLSKAELEKRCQASGLYPSCKWEEKAIRRQIADGRLAARLKGTESRVSPFDRECPICFLHYSQVNVTQCCRAHVCTECYLQVRPQKERCSACPFCNSSKLQVNVAQKMGIDDIQEREEEEQRVIAATIRSRAQEEPESGVASSEGSESSASTFGSSLQQIMRARSESLGDISEQTEQLASLALTPEERRALEEEMRAQHAHPLAKLVEAEAEERRIQNERDYYRTHSGSIRERYSSDLMRFGLGGGVSSISSDAAHRSILSRIDSDTSGLASMPTSQRRARDWNQIVDAFESAGHGEVQSIDDLVVLEAAILLSMEEESRRNLLEGRAGRATFDAASHAREGFPLVQQFLNARGASEEEGGDEDALQTSVRSAGRPARRRSSLLQGRLRRLSAATSTRSMNEEEQMALAIAASLREIGTPPTNDAVGQGDATVGTDNVYYGRQVAVGIAAESDSEVRPAVGIVVADDGDARSAIGTMSDEGTEARPAVGIMLDDSTTAVRPAVGIMADDGAAARPAVGIMVDDGTTARQVVGIMVDDDDTGNTAVGIMADDDDTRNTAVLGAMVEDDAVRLPVGVIAEEPTRGEHETGGFEVEEDRATKDDVSVESTPIQRGVRSIAFGDAVIVTADEVAIPDDDVSVERDNTCEGSTTPAMQDLDEEANDATTGSTVLTTKGAPMTDISKVDLNAPPNQTEVVG